MGAQLQEDAEANVLVFDPTRNRSRRKWLFGAAGIAIAVAIGAAVYRSKLARARSPLLADVRREWLMDRVILERILSADED